MAEGRELPRDELEGYLAEIAGAAETLSRITFRLQEAYGRESDIGLEAQTVTEAVSFLRLDLEKL
jgi:hypothetical protein